MEQTAHVYNHISQLIYQEGQWLIWCTMILAQEIYYDISIKRNPQKLQKILILYLMNEKYLVHRRNVDLGNFYWENIKQCMKHINQNK